MILTPAKRLTALVMCCAMSAVASAAGLTAPLTQTQIVAASTAAAPTQQTFSISTAEDLVVTLTDLQIPAELTSAGVVVTQNGAVVASAQLTPPATVATATGASTQTLNLPGPGIPSGPKSPPPSSPVQSSCIPSANVACSFGAAP